MGVESYIELIDAPSEFSMFVAYFLLFITVVASDSLRYIYTLIISYMLMMMLFLATKIDVGLFIHFNR